MRKFKLREHKENYMLLYITFMFLVLVVSLFFSTVRENDYLDRINSMETVIKNKDKELEDSKDIIEDQNKIILELTKENDKGEVPNEK